VDRYRGRQEAICLPAGRRVCAHESLASKLSDNMEMFWSKEFWPPNSLDLNPMDYYVWNVIE